MTKDYFYITLRDTSEKTMDEYDILSKGKTNTIDALVLSSIGSNRSYDRYFYKIMGKLCCDLTFSCMSGRLRIYGTEKDWLGFIDPMDLKYNKYYVNNLDKIVHYLLTKRYGNDHLVFEIKKNPCKHIMDHIVTAEKIEIIESVLEEIAFKND